MRVFLTGATGFIGGALARALRARGDEVTALVRSPGKTRGLIDLGVTLVSGDVLDVGAMRKGMVGHDAVVHAAAMYEVGIPAAKRAAMLSVNVEGTRAVLAAAADAAVGRVVHVSSMAAYGDTHGKVIDETHPPATTYASVYDESKYKAHQVVLDAMADGAPVIIVAPGGVYGPNDHSQLGNLVTQLLKGRLPATVFGNGGILVAHVDDVADGIVAALDRGTIGETYILGGDKTTTASFIATVAQVAGRTPPRFSVPDGVMKAIAPLGPLVGPVLGYPPNFRELVRIGQSTYWGSSQKAARELDYHPRPLDAVLRDTLRAEGRI